MSGHHFGHHPETEPGTTTGHHPADKPTTRGYHPPAPPGTTQEAIGGGAPIFRWAPPQAQTDDDLDGYFRGNPIDIFTAAVALLDRMRPAWMADASCKEHPGLNFHSRSAAEISKCLQVCARCLVREECRAFADETGDMFGVMGGEDPAARRARWRVRGRQETTT